MHTHLDKEQLSHQLSKWGRELLEQRQVLSRLRHLLPTRFHKAVEAVRRKGPGKNVQRRALLEPTYLAHLEEFNDLSYSVLKTKIEWDTHQMLHKIK